MIPETENPQETKSVYPGKPAQHVKAYPGRNFTQGPLFCFSRGTAHLSFYIILNRGLEKGARTGIVLSLYLLFLNQTLYCEYSNKYSVSNYKKL